VAGSLPGHSFEMVFRVVLGAALVDEGWNPLDVAKLD
jgi:hypothetical protein